MRTRLVVLFACFAALAGCAGVAPRRVGAAAISGRVEGPRPLPADARVVVYRFDEHGIAAPVPAESVGLDRVGRFRTHVLSPGDYVLALRSTDLPQATTRVRVPPAPPATLRVEPSPDLVQLRLLLPERASAPVRCRLTHGQPLGPVADQREIVVAPGRPAFVRAMRPGRWRLDLPESGWTTELILPPGDPLREVLVAPPELSPGAEVAGSILRLDANPAWGVVVTVRPLTEDRSAARAWGRFATSDSRGRYRVLGVPAGPALVRVEVRDRLHRILPPPLEVDIPPSGPVHLGFVVEP